jgi:acyl-ACP thioesterase
VSTRLELPDPPSGAARTPWPLRLSDVDLLGHVNNAAYWHAVEQALARWGPDPARPLRAELDYRSPIDLGDSVELVAASDEVRLVLALAVAGDLRAAGRMTPLA